MGRTGVEVSRVDGMPVHLHSLVVTLVCGPVGSRVAGSAGSQVDVPTARVAPAARAEVTAAMAVSRATVPPLQPVGRRMPGRREMAAEVLPVGLRALLRVLPVVPEAPGRCRWVRRAAEA